MHPVATLLLCVNRRCLVYHIRHSPIVPQSLSGFICNGDFVLVGGSIEGDSEKLVEDYGLSVRNVVDLGVVAAEKMGLIGLKELVKQVLGMEVIKPRRVGDNLWLTPDHVQNASLYVFLSSEIGRRLNTTSGA